jgi:4-aminobutyrate aminotransferase / (S)-3-amino-2-methylpropionate transaminase / 5-aminovalerate transaminase
VAEDYADDLSSRRGNLTRRLRLAGMGEPDRSRASLAVRRTVELRTPIPGPRSRAILAQKRQVVSDAVHVAFPIAVAEARGAWLRDVDGNSFLDFTGGVGCLNVGHSHPRVVAAAQAQLERFTHTVFTEVGYESYGALAERLNRLSPIAGPAKAAFFNTGAEAIENAVKFARSYTRRPAVVVFEGAFHGRTMLALTMTSKASTKIGLAPLAPEVYRVPFPNAFRGPTAGAALDALERAFTTHVPAQSVAAVVLEPIQGEGGFLVAPAEFLAGLRRICDDNGILLIVDEIQSGFGRTGRFFAVEHSGITPDLIVVAKSIAAGLPLSGVIGRAEIMDAPPASVLGGTYVGNPVAQAAALAVLDVIEDEGLVERAVEIGARIRAAMERWQGRFEAIGDVRGVGAMVAVEFVRDRSTKTPAPELAQAVVEAALQRGLLLLTAGLHDSCIRVLCPLVIDDDEVDQAIEIWEQALESALGT